MPEASDDFITVTDGDARHISYSLRMAVGDDITLCNGGKDYFWHGRTWDTSLVKGLDSYLKENGLVDSPDDY